MNLELKQSEISLHFATLHLYLFIVSLFCVKNLQEYFIFIIGTRYYWYFPVNVNVMSNTIKYYRLCSYSYLFRAIEPFLKFIYKFKITSVLFDVTYELSLVLIWENVPKVFRYLDDNNLSMVILWNKIIFVFHENKRCWLALYDFVRNSF